MWDNHVQDAPASDLERWYQQLLLQPLPLVLQSGSASHPAGQIACSPHADSPVHWMSQKQESWQLTPPPQLSRPSHRISQAPAPQVSCAPQERSSLQSTRQEDAWLQSIG